jgi:hypothetical protein
VSFLDLCDAQVRALGRRTPHRVTTRFLRSCS